MLEPLPTDGAGPSNHRWVYSQIEHRRGNAAWTRAAIQDKVDAPTQIAHDVLGRKRIRAAGEVGTGGGQGRAGSRDDTQSDGMVRHPDGNGVAASCENQRQIISTGHDEGEGAGPEAFSEFGGAFRNTSCDALQVAGVGHQQGDGLGARPLLDFVEPLDSLGQEPVGSYTVDGVRGEGDEAAGVDNLGSAFDVLRYAGGQDLRFRWHRSQNPSRLCNQQPDQKREDRHQESKCRRVEDPRPSV